MKVEDFFLKHCFQPDGLFLFNFIFHFKSGKSKVQEGDENSQEGFAGEMDEVSMENNNETGSRNDNKVLISSNIFWFLLFLHFSVFVKWSRFLVIVLVLFNVLVFELGLHFN